MSFFDPYWLPLLMLPPLWILLQRRRERMQPAIPVADPSQFAALPETWRTRTYRQLPVLRALILALVIVALARPQSIVRESTVHSAGVDLVAVLDLSTSMLAEDRPGTTVKNDVPVSNRLTMAKDVLTDFLSSRAGDRIGLVVFGGRAYQAAPLTTDHEWLRATVGSLQIGVVEDGTAVGDALLAALARLADKAAANDGDKTTARPSPRAIILITDGRSNAGTTKPIDAAAAAKALGVRIHAIGIGSRDQALLPVADPLGGVRYQRIQVDLDETTLREIAATSGGSYSRADDKEMLARVFREIDRLEKRPIEQKIHFAYQEWFAIPILIALALAAIELFLRATLLRRLP